MNGISNAHRALWMVLVTSLSTPFFVALAMVALIAIAAIAGVPLPAGMQISVGDIAIASFVWASFPAAIAAFALVPFVLQHGTYSWLHAAIAGVVACAAAAIIFPLNGGPLLSVIAFAGGLIAIGLRMMLITYGILKP